MCDCLIKISVCVCVMETLLLLETHMWISCLTLLANTMNQSLIEDDDDA